MLLSYNKNNTGWLRGQSACSGSVEEGGRNKTLAHPNSQKDMGGTVHSQHLNFLIGFHFIGKKRSNQGGKAIFVGLYNLIECLGAIGG